MSKNKAFYETKTYTATAYTMLGIGRVCQGATATKNFVKEHATPLAVVTVAVGVQALAYKKLHDIEIGR